MSNLGVYYIKNLKNGKLYIGCGNVKRRFVEHKCRLRKGEHANSHLQRSWDKYGEDAFDFCQIKYTDRREMLETEKFLIKNFETTDGEKGYNMTKGGEGEEVNDRVKKLMSEKHSGEGNPFYERKHGQDTLELISKNSRGENNSTSKLQEQEVVDILKELAYTDKTMDKIGQDFGVSKHTVKDIKFNRSWSHVGNEIRVDIKFNRHQDRDTIVRIKELLSNTEKPQKQIAKEVGVKPNLVAQINNKNSYANVRPDLELRTSPVENGNSKLNEELVRKMRLDLRDGDLTYEELADKYEVSVSTVCRISRRESWKNVTI